MAYRRRPAGVQGVQEHAGDLGRGQARVDPGRGPAGDPGVPPHAAQAPVRAADGLGAGQQAQGPQVLLGDGDPAARGDRGPGCLHRVTGAAVGPAGALGVTAVQHRGADVDLVPAGRARQALLPVLA